MSNLKSFVLLSLISVAVPFGAIAGSDPAGNSALNAPLGSSGVGESSQPTCVSPSDNTAKAGDDDSQISNPNVAEPAESKKGS